MHNNKKIILISLNQKDLQLPPHFFSSFLSDPYTTVMIQVIADV